jgi:hypothetical protein
MARLLGCTNRSHTPPKYWAAGGEKCQCSFFGQFIRQTWVTGAVVEGISQLFLSSGDTSVSSTDI